MLVGPAVTSLHFAERIGLNTTHLCSKISAKTSGSTWPTYEGQTVIHEPATMAYR